MFLFVCFIKIKKGFPPILLVMIKQVLNNKYVLTFFWIKFLETYLQIVNIS